MNGALQSVAPGIKQPIRSEHGIPQSPYLLTDECAAYMRFRCVKTFRNWLNTAEGRKLPRCRRGGILLFDVRMVDAFVADLLSHRTSKQSVARRFSVVRHDESVAASDAER